MTSNEKIIMFMEEKDKCLKSYNKDLNYFNEDDKQDILQWSTEDANNIWTKLTNNEHSYGISKDTCSFCLHNKYCSTCTYGERHGKCGIGTSCINTYCEIIAFFNKLSISLNFAFSKEFYSNLIEKIEEKSIENSSKGIKIKYITKDKYRGLDPEIVDLLKQGKIIKGTFTIIGSPIVKEGYLSDYDVCHCSYYNMVDNNWYDGFKPILKGAEEGIDWSKIPVDTKVLVKDREEDEWQKAYFAKFENGSIKVFTDGRTSFSCIGITRFWRFVKLYKEGEK